MTELLVVCPPARAGGTNGWAPPPVSLVTAFLAGRNARTAGAYRQDLDAFRRFLQVPTLDDAAHRLLAAAPGDAHALALAYQAHLLERGLQATTVNRRLATLRSLVQFAGTVGRVTWTLDVKNVKTQPYRDTTGPGKTAIRAMLEALQARQDAKAQRDRAALRLLYDLGLRRGEVVALDVADMDLTAGTVAVLGKGRRQKDILALPEPTQAALRGWLTVRGWQPGPVFTNFDRARKGSGRLTGVSLYRIVRALGAQVGFTVRPHGLRHTAITEACKAAQAHGIALEEVLDFSRHTDVKVLMIYRDRERNVQRTLAALVAAHA
jgi:integrase/recombinase XerC